MRFLKVLGVLMFVLALGAIAPGETNHLGIREVSRVKFVAPIRVGTVLLPAGDYVVRHMMEGQEHIMVFPARPKQRSIQSKIAGSACQESRYRPNDL